MHLPASASGSALALALAAGGSSAGLLGAATVDLFIIFLA